MIEHIVYDFSDSEMMERFRPSLEEATPVQNQIVALDYIGKRGSAVNVGRRERVQYARDILQKEASAPGRCTGSPLAVLASCCECYVCSPGTPPRGHGGQQRDEEGLLHRLCGT